MYDFTNKKMDEIIAPFRRSFWIEDKKWFVNFECDASDSSNIDLYSIPICKPSFHYTWPYKKLFLSTFPMKNTFDSTMMDNVDTLWLRLSENTATEAEQQVCSRLKHFFSSDEKRVINFIISHHCLIS